MKNIYVISLLITLLIICLATLYEIFYVRRKKLQREIASLIGEQFAQKRSDEDFGPIPSFMLERAMNQTISLTDEVSALQSIKTMIELGVETSRRNIPYPIIHIDVLKTIQKWAQSNREIGKEAIKLSGYIIERHLQLIDEFMMSSKKRISETDTDAANNTLRNFNNLLDNILSSGMALDPKMILANPNKNTVEMWAQKGNKTSKYAQTLLDTVEEAKRKYINK